MTSEEGTESQKSDQAVDQDAAEAKSPDYGSGSAEDKADGAPVGKEALTEADEDLPEDQTAFQTDSS